MKYRKTLYNAVYKDIGKFFKYLLKSCIDTDNKFGKLQTVS